MNAVDPLGVAAVIGATLDDLGIRYVIGGGVASVYHGEPRTTVDLDLMIEANEAQVRALAARLAADFYVDAEDAVDAVRYGRSFNVIQFSTAMKVDIYIAEPSPAAREQLDRRRFLEYGGAILSIYAAEDIAVRKLVWFRMGGEVSERQWRDVVGIIRMRRPQLDYAYLDRSAEAFGVRDLLDLAHQDADN
jgi:hypothetical protein